MTSEFSRSLRVAPEKERQEIAQPTAISHLDEGNNRSETSKERES